MTRPTRYGPRPMTTASTFDPSPSVAAELALAQHSVRAVVALLSEGASVPFIARYRKEQTGGLDEVQIRSIQERSAYVKELHERKATVREEIERQGKLTPELAKKIEACTEKAVLEDLYLPYKPKRRTRAMIARERGLEPLAIRILAQPMDGDPVAEGTKLLGDEVPDAKAAIAGACDIVAELVSERAEVRALVRRTVETEGEITCDVTPDKKGQPTKFETYYGYSEKLATLPSHRYLAIRRGETEGVLRTNIVVDQETLTAKAEAMFGLQSKSPFAPALHEATNDGLARIAVPSIQTDLRIEKKLAADKDAVQVFAENLRRLLLAAPLGRRTVLGIDPGQRTGCKCVVVDDTGRLLDHTLVNLVMGEGALAHAKKTIAALLVKHTPFAIGVGNGTHGRETADFCRAILAEVAGAKPIIVLVSEAGASVYSASDVAREEFPDLDLTVRGAVSIARRLQDPLAELVKIDPKSIGVCQYQHDVFQPLLKRKLDEVIESCVNAVGVELNTASAPLLARVAGVGPTLAKRIVEHRDGNGAFASRSDLKKVAGLGARTFEHCAGFLRVRGAKHPLDASAVHPERYALVAQIAKDAGVGVAELVGNGDLLAKVDWKRYVSGDVGMPTLEDIRAELQKPGRDPRDAFEAPAFRDDVRTMEDLRPGMVLEGVVTNVTAFGAFVDVGVHQDGLVHVSQLADRFVKDPHEVAKVGEKMRVRVLEIDLVRKRIALTARSDANAAKPSPNQPSQRAEHAKSARTQPQRGNAPKEDFANRPFANLKRS
ncbi:Tex family protein [soil metagenome]